MTSHILCCNICIVIPLLNNQLPESISQIWFFIVFFYHSLVEAFTNSHDSLPLPYTNTLCYVTAFSSSPQQDNLCQLILCLMMRLASSSWCYLTWSKQKLKTKSHMGLSLSCVFLPLTVKHARACLLEHERHVEQSYVT